MELFINTLILHFNPLPDNKLKDFAEDNLKFEENGRKLYKPVENTVGKGEIAQCFQKACFRLVSQGRQKVSLCGNGLMSTKPFNTVKRQNVITQIQFLTLYHIYSSKF